MPNQEKLPRALVYARIPDDCAATRASYDACCRQAGDDGCTVVGGSKKVPQPCQRDRYRRNVPVRQ